MKKIVIAPCLLLCLLFPVFVHAQKDSGTIFSKAKNWQQVLEEAKEANKPIFLDLYTTWCAPCARIEKEVFPDPQVASFMNVNFITVRVQMDTTSHDNEYVKGWREDAAKWNKYAPAFPTFLFYTVDGTYSGREGGFHAPGEFLTMLKKVINPKNSYLDQISAFNKGELSRQQLLKLAYLAKDNKEDSIADQVAKVYKEKYVDPLSVDSLLNKEADRFHATFIKLFSFKDKIIQYIYSHQDSTDKKFERWPKYSKNLTDFVISRDYIYSKKSESSYPQWEKMRKAIARDFDNKVAERLILNAKISSSYGKKDYPQAVRLELYKIDKYGLDTSAMGRVHANNLIYDVAFKYVDDKEILEKALSIMRRVIEHENGESHGHLDTYACILYKLGEKKEAIEMENKAIDIATKSNDTRNIPIYKEIISKMEKGVAIWKEVN
ncbi:thioredoxin family protein [Pedobacter faecalis]|uniref:thioredoxin family protein n=1 Tax=Pedobacter faecalis TaxID=3041495 RepID=UPI00254DCF8A|nr:thioredoxin family protein [Pedobacter sp. ELA7]